MRHGDIMTTTPRCQIGRVVSTPSTDARRRFQLRVLYSSCTGTGRL